MAAGDLPVGGSMRAGWQDVGQMLARLLPITQDDAVAKKFPSLSEDDRTLAPAVLAMGVHVFNYLIELLEDKKPSEEQDADFLRLLRQMEALMETRGLRRSRGVLGQ